MFRILKANYGRSNRNFQQRPTFTKLPVGMFVDCSDNGPTFCLLREIYLILDKKQLKSSDVSVNDVSLLEEIVQSSEKALLNVCTLFWILFCSIP